MACSLLIKKVKNTDAGMPKLQRKDIKEAYFDPSAEIWYTSAKKTAEIKTAEIKNTFTLAGDSGLTGNSN